MISLPRKDMEHCIKIGTFGANRRGSLKNARKGDKVVCYVTKECKIIASGELTSDYFMDDKEIFNSEGIFPDRFNFKAEKLKAGKELDIKAIIDDLSFVTNKAYWSVFFRMSNRLIPQKDYDLIKSRL
jgi:predicted RNA-binding protein